MVIQNGMGGIVEIWFQIDMIGTFSQKIIDVLQLFLPCWVGGRVESKVDIRRIDGHQRKENRANVIFFAFPFDFRQILDNIFCGNGRAPQAVGACQAAHLCRSVPASYGQYLRCGQGSIPGNQDTS